MTISTPQNTPAPDARLPRIQTDWHSAARQAERDLVRLGWARQVLEPTGDSPVTHSIARVRLAQHIFATQQSDPL